MVNGKFLKSSLNKPSQKCRLKNVPQLHYCPNVSFFSTVKDAKWVFMLLKHVNNYAISATIRHKGPPKKE